MDPIGWQGTNTDALRFSDTVWGNIPVRAIRDRKVNGTLIEENFSTFQSTVPTTAGNWAAQNGYEVFSSTGGFINPASTVGGGITIGSDDDNEGVGIRTVATPFKLINDGTVGIFAAEFIVSFSTIGNTTFEAFLGLMEAATLTAIIPITTTAATLADKNLVGLYRTESAGSAVSSTYKCDGVTAVTVGSGEGTLVASTVTKLALKLTPRGDRGGAYTVSFYQDGVRLTSYKQLPTAAGTDFPNDVNMGIVMATRNAAGSSPGSLTIKGFRAAQLFPPYN